MGWCSSTAKCKCCGNIWDGGWAHLLHMGLLGKGDSGDGMGRDTQLLSIHFALLHFHNTCKGGAVSTVPSHAHLQKQRVTVKGNQVSVSVSPFSSKGDESLLEIRRK